MVVETSNGWLLEISRVQWWSDDDGAVFGRMFKGQSWTAEKYIGTVRGIREVMVGRLRLVRN